ncbi:MAG: FtsW/RodA/SpoVE family cell cycle protein [Bacteroidales bacterium]|nr:FtsW/RodA/SpoVE family cell cycle protein [Bacteroidales bacterium]
MDLTKALFKGDRVIWTVFFFLCIISVVEVYSASSMLSYKSAVRHFDPIIRHATFLIAGTGLIILIQNLSLKRIQMLGFAALILGILFLVYALVGGMKVNDATRWVSFFGIRFQPSEFAKLGVIITTSYILSKFQDENNASPKAFKWIMIISLVVCAFIIKENISTAVLLFTVVYILMFIGRVEFKKLGIVAAIAIGLIVLAGVTITHLPKKFLQETRLETAASRVNSFIGKDKDSASKKIDLSGKDCQKYYGKIAIANGKVFGMMPGNSETRDFLPQAFSDFIFAIILEETGLVGGVVVIFLYFILLFRVGIIAKRCNKVFPALVIIGCALIIAFQALINMSVAVNLIPVTGQPLPLISRGGTSTLISCIYFGVILAVSQFANESAAKAKAEKEGTINIDDDPVTEKVIFENIEEPVS